MRRNYESNPFLCYHTSLSEDLIANAEGLAVALGLIPRSANGWKWAVLAADMMATTALVLYVNDSSGTAALDKRSRDKWVRLIEGEFFDPVPDKRLADLGALLSRATAGLPGALPPLGVGERDRKNLLTLHDQFRNEFIHFKPDGLLIYVDGLPAWIESAIKVTEAVLATGRHYWDPESDQAYWIETITLARRRLQRIEFRIRKAAEIDCGAL